MSAWTLAWLAWGALFVGIEGLALARRRRDPDTLSEHVWWLRDRKIGPVPVGWLVLAPFWAWLTLHFFM